MIRTLTHPPGACDFKTLHRQMKRAITRERRTGWPSDEVRIAAERLRLLLKACAMNKVVPKVMLVAVGEYTERLTQARAAAARKK